MRRYLCCICIVALTAMGVAWAVEDATFTAESVMQVTVVDGNAWAHHTATVMNAMRIAVAPSAIPKNSGL